MSLSVCWSREYLVQSFGHIQETGIENARKGVVESGKSASAGHILAEAGTSREC